MKKIILTVLIAANIYSVVHAKPQYAVRTKQISCTSCHYSPSGGGPRRLFGKAYGSHALGSGVYSSNELLTADIRAVSMYMTKETSKNANGSGIMSTTIGAGVPIVTNEDGSEYHAVINYEAGGFGPNGTKETFVRYQSSLDEGFSPQHITVGKFIIPFGLLTDEHRTFTKKQSNTSINSYEFGAMFSGNIKSNLHYDIAIVEGFQKNAGIPDKEIKWGTVANVRWNPGFSSLMLGASATFNKSLVRKSPWAAVAYSMLSLDEFTNSTIKGSFISELVLAQHFNNEANNSLISEFVNSSSSESYYNEIEGKKSLGALVRFDIELTKKLNSFYKLNLMALDKANLKDYYMRNSIGLKYYINSNIDVEGRFEIAKIRRAGIAETKVAASRSNRLIMLGHVWF